MLAKFSLVASTGSVIAVLSWVLAVPGWVFAAGGWRLPVLPRWQWGSGRAGGVARHWRFPFGGLQSGFRPLGKNAGCADSN